MATVRKEFSVDAPAERVWAVLQDFGAVHTRLAPGFVTDTKLEAGARVVTFASGATAREALVSMDDARRRLVYAVVGSEHLTHHNASVEVLAEGAGAKVVWTADFLPDAAAGPLDEIMGIGAEAMRKALGSA